MTSLPTHARESLSAEPGRTYVKSLNRSDESQTFAYGYADTVRLGDLVIGRIVCQPGWHWREQIKPIAGTASCEFHHSGVGLRGELRFRMDDGTEVSVREGDVFDIPPGHDVWVVGEEPSVSIMWGGWRGFGKPPVTNRVVTTLVFTDIVGSTEHAARVGDSAWDQLLDRHDSSVRDILEEFQGRVIATTGDGFLATFDGVARALQAVHTIMGAVHELGLQIRAAVHTGEVELVPGNIRGLAVHEASRILDLADPSEILVSSTTRDLASGAGMGFIDRGSHRLAGVPDQRQVFAVTFPDSP